MGGATERLVIFSLLIGQLFTLLTLMYNARQARLREERKRVAELQDRIAAREIEVEDRRALAAQVVTTATNVAQHVETTALNIAQHVEQTTARLHKAISDNTEETRQVGQKADAAYTEANHVNTKISDLNERLLQQAKGSGRPH